MNIYVLFEIKKISTSVLSREEYIVQWTRKNGLLFSQTVQLCCMSAGAGIVSDTVQMRRYGKVKKYRIWMRLYIMIKYIFI
jgi:NADH:ubiquinone oxidoreductase subunit B-like Fe-S oxidoreductase